MRLSFPPRFLHEDAADRVPTGNPPPASGRSGRSPLMAGRWTRTRRGSGSKRVFPCHYLSCRHKRVGCCLLVSIEVALEREVEQRAVLFPARPPPGPCSSSVRSARAFCAPILHTRDFTHVQDPALGPFQGYRNASRHRGDAHDARRDGRAAGRFVCLRATWRGAPTTNGAAPSLRAARSGPALRPRRRASPISNPSGCPACICP